MKKVVQSVLLILIILLSPCGDVVDYEYGSHRNFFTFHNETHQNPILALAMNPLSPGVCCTTRTNVVSGRYCFFFESSQGLRPSAPVRFDGIDLRLESWKHVDLNNGLVVNYGSSDNPFPFYAYDLQYPNCFNTNTPPLHSYELKMSSDGFGICDNCHHKYSLNTGGNIVSGNSSEKLVHYRASSTDPYGVLGAS